MQDTTLDQKFEKETGITAKRKGKEYRPQYVAWLKEQVAFPPKQLFIEFDEMPKEKLISLLSTLFASMHSMADKIEKELDD